MTRTKEATGSELKALGTVGRRLFVKSRRQVKIEELSSEDVIIGVMGPTGSGKSSFIEVVTGIKGIVGHSLKSCTNEISVIKFSVPEILDSDICLVDTPGFDSTNKSEGDVLRMISDWLNNTYKRRIPLAGLLYFHRITDDPITEHPISGTPSKDFRLFEKVCGKEFSKIVLTTTMWDEVEPEMGEKRESELQDTYWKSMIERGSTVKRFLFTPSSAFDVLRPILTRANECHSLLLQKEVTDLGMKLRETTAGRALAMQVEELVPSQQKLLAAIRNDLMDSKLRPDQLEKLQQDYQEVSAQLQSVIKDVKRSNISVGERFLKAVRVKNLKRIWSIFRSKKEK